jgi:predicted dehydrogenase
VHCRSNAWHASRCYMTFPTKPPQAYDYVTFQTNNPTDPLPANQVAGDFAGHKTALHVLDAFVNLLGPVRRVNAQFVSRRPPPDPLDTISVLVEFANGASGVLASMRATPFYWRVHAFGTAGSAEALGENVFIIRRGNGHTRQETLPPVDSLRAELDAFVESIVGQKPPPIPATQMIDTVAAFEAAITSINSRMPTMVGATSSA